MVELGAPLALPDRAIPGRVDQNEVSWIRSYTIEVQASGIPLSKDQHWHWEAKKNTDSLLTCSHKRSSPKDGANKCGLS